MPQSTVSRHLAHLKNAGLVSDRRCKTWAYYRMSEDAQPFARNILAMLGKHLAELDPTRKDIASLHEYRSCSEISCE